MLVIPAVGRITETWTSGRTLRLNIATEVNKEYADSLRVTTMPTYILFDTSGQALERWMNEAPTVDELPK